MEGNASVVVVHSNSGLAFACRSASEPSAVDGPAGDAEWLAMLPPLAEPLDTDGRDWLVDCPRDGNGMFCFDGVRAMPAPASWELIWLAVDGLWASGDRAGCESGSDCKVDWFAGDSVASSGKDRDR